MIAFIITLYIILNIKIRTRKLLWKIIKFPFLLLIIWPIKYFMKKRKADQKIKMAEFKKAETERLKREKIQNKINEIQNKINNSNA